MRLRSFDHGGDRDFNRFLNVRNTREPEGALIQDWLVDRLEPVVRVILAIALRDIAANVLGIGPVSSPDALCTQSSAPVSQPMLLLTKKVHHPQPGKKKKKDRGEYSLSNASLFLLKSSCVASVTGI